MTRKRLTHFGVAIVACGAVFALSGCYGKRRVQVYHDRSPGDPDVTLTIYYQTSIINHPGSMRILLETNPQVVTLYNAPIGLAISGGEFRFAFNLPRPGDWTEPRRFDNDSPNGGWVILDGDTLRFGLTPRE